MMNIPSLINTRTGICCLLAALTLSAQAAPLGDVPDQAGTGDIAVDPSTHTVWIAYKNGPQCFVQPFMPAH